MQTKTIHRLSILIVAALSLYVLWYSVRKVLPSVPLPDISLSESVNGLSEPLDTIVQSPRGEIRAYLAASPVGREKGLSGRESLDRDEGMLFVFPGSGLHGFWMNEMLFSIDIIWMDEDGSAVHILPNVSPDTYPEVFTPPVPARYVLELAAGGAAMWGVEIGSVLGFDI